MGKELKKMISSMGILSLSLAMGFTSFTPVRAEEETPYGDINGDPIISEVELTAEEVAEADTEAAEETGGKASIKDSTLV